MFFGGMYNNIDKINKTDLKLLQMSKIIARLPIMLVLTLLTLLVSGCGQANYPDARTPDIPPTARPYEKMDAIRGDKQSVVKLPLGKDILVPRPLSSEPLPNAEVGPFELRGETLAGALQLILADLDISMAFETNEGLTRRITVANLKGNLNDVVDKVCSLADLYCSYKNGILTVKENEVFMVDLPPISTGGVGTTGSIGGIGSTGSVGSSAYTSIETALKAIVGGTPAVDYTARVLVYTATHRSNKYAEEYFEKLRKNTALIVFETHIWEVTLNNENRTGIDWSGMLRGIGNFDIDIAVPGAAPAGTATPVTITPTFSGSGNLNFTTILQFISEHGAVKTISQPQITVMSGSSATLDVRQSENYVSEFSRTPSTVAGVADTVSTTTDTVETGLRVSITSAWDKSTVYGTINISLDELLRIDNFSPSPNTIIQLPATTTRSLNTQVRVRPGDAILIAGLVTERDEYTGSGPGLLKPLFTTARAAKTKNTELVFMLKPRVIMFTDKVEKVNNIISSKVKASINEATTSVKQLSDDSIRANEKDEIAVSEDKSVGEVEYPELSISPQLFAPQLPDTDNNVREISN